MKYPTRVSFAMLVTAGALAAALSAPAAFAEDGHGGRDSGRGSDDVVTTTTPVVVNDVNDDRGADAQLPAGTVDERHDDVNDDD